MDRDRHSKKILAARYLAPRALLVRSRPVKSLIDGHTVWAVIPFSDEELWKRVDDLSDDEFRRLCNLWQSRREEPWQNVPQLRNAHEQILRLQKAPGVLRQRRGRHKGQLGDNPVEIELIHQFLKRLHKLTLEALSARPSRTRRRPHAIVDCVIAGLGPRCLITGGPLKDQIVQWGHHLDEIRLHFFGAVQDILPLDLQSDQSRATEIVLSFLGRREHGEEPLSLRHLHRILKQTRSPKPLQDVIPPPGV